MSQAEEQKSDSVASHTATSSNSIEQGNKLIALFMGDTVPVKIGWAISSRPANTSFLKAEQVTDWSKALLYYHSSWNKLMEVVDKIQDGDTWLQGGADVTIFYKNCLIEYSDEDIEYDVGGVEGETKIEAVWKAVIQFIEWYNQNKKESDHQP